MATTDPPADKTSTGKKPPDDEFLDPLEDYGPAEYTDPLEKILAEDPVSKITSRPCPRIGPETSVQKALELLTDLDCACTLVEEDGRLIGLFSEWDALRRVAGEYDDLKGVRVDDVMTRDPVFVYDFDCVAAILSVIALCGYRHVPVLDADEKIVGIVTPRRITSFLQDRLAEVE